MQIYIASDHAGFELKNKIFQHIKRNYDANIIDVGCYNNSSCDYPDYAKLLCKEIQPFYFGILVCGSGQGMCMTANKFDNIRASLAHSEESAKLAREHNDSNVICLGSRCLDTDTAIKCVDKFITTPFSSEERHKNRKNKINNKI